jgi:hypothetical protein
LIRHPNRSIPSRFRKSFNTSESARVSTDSAEPVTTSCEIRFYQSFSAPIEFTELQKYNLNYVYKL